MTNDPMNDERERALAELFDETAAKPSALERQRLLDAAATVAEHGAARRHLDRRFVWPAALAAAAAISYLVVAPAGLRGRAVEAVPSVRVTAAKPLAVDPVPAAVEPSASHAAPQNAPSAEDVDDPLTATDGDELDELEPLELGPLFAPSESARGVEIANAVEHLSEGE